MHLYSPSEFINAGFERKKRCTRRKKFWVFLSSDCALCRVINPFYSLLKSQFFLQRYGPTIHSRVLYNGWCIVLTLFGFFPRKLAITIYWSPCIRRQPNHDRLQKVHALGQMYISLVPKIVGHFPLERTVVWTKFTESLMDCSCISLRVSSTDLHVKTKVNVIKSRVLLNCHLTLQEGQIAV